MSGADLHVPAGAAAEGPDRVVIEPERAGWSYCGLRVVALPPSGSRALDTQGHEVAVLPLAGSVDVEVDGQLFSLVGRESVFDRVSDWAYVPVGAEARLASGDGAEVAVASARAERRFEPAYVAAGDVPVEIRGAGSATRQIVNFLAPEAFAGAHRLICVEVLTPDGNWSSYPPHKHDDSPDSPAENEEIYYFRIGRTGDRATSRDGFALHRTYTTDGALDETVVVRDGDVFLVPRGYHGPSVAAPGYPLYYLNVMAGPNPERTMAIVDDPPHAWIRDAWSALEPDPRCPLITAS
jgi:5-deoxy-glucuronate isomerase